MIHRKDKSSSVIIEVDQNKDNVEVVNWHYLNENQLEQKIRQAEREGGRVLTLESVAGNTSNNLSSAGKDSERIAGKQESEQENDDVLYRDDEGGKGE